MSTLPDFIIIGAMKSGTSSLHKYLDQHPDICMSVVKEPNYFSKTRTVLHKGWGWYRNLFPDPLKLTGESSTAYTKYPMIQGVPARIKKRSPNVKMIYLMREPIARTLSHISHDMLEALIPFSETGDTFVENFEASEYVQFSRYTKQLEQYHAEFTQDQFLLITTDRLKSDSKGLLNQICEFLEVTTFDFDFSAQANVTEDRKRITDRAKYKREKEKGVADSENPFRVPFTPPTLSDETVERLKNYLEADIALFNSVNVQQ